MTSFNADLRSAINFWFVDPVECNCNYCLDYCYVDDPSIFLLGLLLLLLLLIKACTLNLSHISQLTCCWGANTFTLTLPAVLSARYKGGGSIWIQEAITPCSLLFVEQGPQEMVAKIVKITGITTFANSFLFALIALRILVRRRINVFLYQKLMAPLKEMAKNLLWIS